MQKITSVDEYILKLKSWQQEIARLRVLLQETELTETIKWGMPTYTLKGRHVVGLSAFQSYFGLWFHQGVFLSDPGGLLVNAQEGKTKGMRQLRLKSADFDLDLIRRYIAEAIENEKAGKRVQVESNTEVLVPTELSTALAKDPALQECFSALTPGKQKEYSEHITAAKREATRIRRLDKVIPMIKTGKGLNDKYRSC